METRKYIAKTFQGLETVLEKELNDLGIFDCQIVRRSVVFECSQQHMILANLCLRTALRIYMPIASFEIKSKEDLYKKTYNIGWENYFSPENTFMIESVINSEIYKNSHYAGLKCKDAIVDRFRKIKKDRPSIDTTSPDFRIQLHISNLGVCTISLDTSGDALYKRGYKNRQTEASINECLAAGMLLLADWKGNKDFYSPMCGSGTLLIEAATIASNLAPNLYRKKWGFEQFKDYNPTILQKIREELLSKVRYSEKNFFASDILGSAIDIAKMNFYDAHLDLPYIYFSKENFFETRPATKEGFLIINPPYNERIGLEDESSFYKDMGNILKNYYKGFDVWIISSNKSALRKIGLKDDKRFLLVNGKLPCEFCSYPIQ